MRQTRGQGFTFRWIFLQERSGEVTMDEGRFSARYTAQYAELNFRHRPRYRPFLGVDKRICKKKQNKKCDYYMLHDITGKLRANINSWVVTKPKHAGIFYYPLRPVYCPINATWTAYLDSFFFRPRYTTQSANINGWQLIQWSEEKKTFPHPWDRHKHSSNFCRVCSGLFFVLLCVCLRPPYWSAILNRVVQQYNQKLDKKKKSLQ